MPTLIPTLVPTSSPTENPTESPSRAPTAYPTAVPTISPTPAPSCVSTMEWSEVHADQLCPGHAHHAYGVELCTLHSNPDYRRRLEFALANRLWSSCSHKCLYDYDSYKTDEPLAFLWTGYCYKINHKVCIDKAAEQMALSHAYAATLCETTLPCVEIIEWNENVAKENCPDGYGGSSHKRWEVNKLCPKLVRLDNGFYDTADVVYGASFDRSLANHIFRSCTAKCVYDIENEELSYRWNGGNCWEVQQNQNCIKRSSKDYEWALAYVNERVCHINPQPEPPTPCIERETEWTEEVARKICSSNDMGITNKGADATVCAGFEEYQYRLDLSLANRAFLQCDSSCVYDISEIGSAFSWRNVDSCWKPTTTGVCISRNPLNLEKITDYIENMLCVEPTAAPTCIAEQEWSEHLMDVYCSPVETGGTYKHYSSIGRAATPCSRFEQLKDNLLKSLAMRLYDQCSSTCIYDYYSDGENAWKWSFSGFCWKLEAWGSCQWDYKLARNQPFWTDIKGSMCTPLPPAECIRTFTWNNVRAEKLCSNINAINSHKFYGVPVCDDAISATKQASLDKSLANKFFHRCTSMCVYDYDTIINNIRSDSRNYGGFFLQTTCWKWVTSGECFPTSLLEFEEISLHAQDLCDAQ